MFNSVQWELMVSVLPHPSTVSFSFKDKGDKDEERKMNISRDALIAYVLLNT